MIGYFTLLLWQEDYLPAFQIHKLGLDPIRPFKMESMFAGPCMTDVNRLIRVA